nr:hypothetical protein GCM10020092_062240 [Actinoplanes digitatis]
MLRGQADDAAAGPDQLFYAGGGGQAVALAPAAARYRRVDGLLHRLDVDEADRAGVLVPSPAMSIDRVSPSLTAITRPVQVWQAGPPEPGRHGTEAATAGVVGMTARPPATVTAAARAARRRRTVGPPTG